MIGAIVLAAGSSRRFGDDKRRALLANGRMVITQTLETVLGSFDAVLLVLRYGDNAFEEEIQASINKPGLKTFRAPESALGMGHSLANAIHEQVVRDWDGAFIFLADMPHIQPATIEQLQSAFTEHRSAQPIIVPTLNDTWGHPVGFDAAWFDEIAALEGDQGARPVIRRNESHVIQVAVADEGILKDVDRPEDLSQQIETASKLVGDESIKVTEDFDGLLDDGLD